MGRRKQVAKTQVINQTIQGKVKKRKKVYPKSPEPSRRTRARRALYEINQNKVSLRNAAKIYNLSYGYLHRRVSGELDVDKRKGPATVFTAEEEEAMAHWLSEMAERGMGLKPVEFLDFIEGIVKKENRSTPFKNGRPGHDWYYSFMARNSAIVKPRKETPLEMCRAKLSKEKIDHWYSTYRDFVVSKGLIDSPKRIWNADETGFSMGSTAGKVIGPIRQGNVPHITGGHSKQRYSVMFCGSAGGEIMPPFFIYPEPKPRGFNPLAGATEGSDIVYTAKGWMDAVSFRMFIKHFDKHAGAQRPVILLFDSVSSHVDMLAFEDAKSRGIELYRLYPNATHLMQPLDKGVFGPLKLRWHQVVRKHTRENPGAPITKHNFVEKLKEAFLLFYKPLTVINSFKSSGIYPIDGNMITKDHLKPGLTFQVEEHGKQADSGRASPIEKHNVHIDETDKAQFALEALKSVLATPTRRKYENRIDEEYDIEGVSPGFDIFKKLHNKAKCKTPTTSEVKESGLNVLADVAAGTSYVTDTHATPSISPVLKESLSLPKVDESSKTKRKMLLDSLPDNLTSDECLKAMALKELQKVKVFAEREKRAKKSYMKGETTIEKKEGKKTKKRLNLPIQEFPKPGTSKETEEECMGCHMSWSEDQELGLGTVWLQCDMCDGWIHKDCCTDIESVVDIFHCPKCQIK